MRDCLLFRRLLITRVHCTSGDKLFLEHYFELTINHLRNLGNAMIFKTAIKFGQIKFGSDYGMLTIESLIDLGHHSQM